MMINTTAAWPGNIVGLDAFSHYASSNQHHLCFINLSTSIYMARENAGDDAHTVTKIFQKVNPRMVNFTV